MKVNFLGMLLSGSLLISACQGEKEESLKKEAKNTPQALDHKCGQEDVRLEEGCVEARKSPLNQGDTLETLKQYFPLKEPVLIRDIETANVPFAVGKYTLNKNFWTGWEVRGWSISGLNSIRVHEQNSLSLDIMDPRVHLGSWLWLQKEGMEVNFCSSGCLLSDSKLSNSKKETTIQEDLQDSLSYHGYLHKYSSNYLLMGTIGKWNNDKTVFFQDLKLNFILPSHQKDQMIPMVKLFGKEMISSVNEISLFTIANSDFKMKQITLGKIPEEIFGFMELMVMNKNNEKYGILYMYHHFFHGAFSLSDDIRENSSMCKTIENYYSGEDIDCLENKINMEISEKIKLVGTPYYREYIKDRSDKSYAFEGFIIKDGKKVSEFSWWDSSLSQNKNLSKENWREQGVSRMEKEMKEILKNLAIY